MGPGRNRGGRARGKKPVGRARLRAWLRELERKFCEKTWGIALFLRIQDHSAASKVRNCSPGGTCRRQKHPTSCRRGASRNQGRRPGGKVAAPARLRRKKTMSTFALTGGLSQGLPCRKPAAPPFSPNSLLGPGRIHPAGSWAQATGKKLLGVGAGPPPWRRGPAHVFGGLWAFVRGGNPERHWRPEGPKSKLCNPNHRAEGRPLSAAPDPKPTVGRRGWRRLRTGWGRKKHLFFPFFLSSFRCLCGRRGRNVSGGPSGHGTR